MADTETPRHAFNRSPKPTIGVEWEVALLDPETRDLVPRAAEIIEAASRRDPAIHLEPEFLQNTVEIVTGVHDTAPQAVGELERAAAVVRAAAKDRGLSLWSAGSHPFSDFRKNPVSGKSSYKEIIERTQYWGSQMLIWGIHVHVGISHEDRVWPIINALMTKYPHMLALTASSPGWDGLDTGYASNRTMLYQQLPTAGMPLNFRSWQEWLDYMRDQDRSGVISHTRSMHLDIRPAAKWGTIEVRVADAAPNLRELAAVVALTHCLVVHFDRLIDAGEKLPFLPVWHNAENKWRGARYGLDSLVIVDADTNERWVKDELAELTESLAPLARELGCADELALIPEILETGSSSDRQRRIFRAEGSWVPAVDETVAEMDVHHPPVHPLGDAV